MGGMGGMPGMPGFGGGDMDFSKVRYLSHPPVWSHGA
jgi:hypothetical protein